ncbi:MAG: cupredoxin domain-containing protein, partial [Actinomycetota bacterium]
RRSRWTALVAGLFALSIVFAACSSDDGGGGETGGDTGGGGGGGDSIVIEGFAFNPSTITVSGPTEVTITNNDSASHTFTLDDGSIDEEIGAGESTSVTIDVSASTGFVCRFHPQMTGTVEVA